MKVLTWVGIAAFAGFAAFGLSRALGTRESGETITGNAAANESSAERLRENAEANPDDYSARIAYARLLLGNDLAAALREYDAASRIDPSQPEPLTYIGWINALAARELEAGTQRDALVQRALGAFEEALTLDPEYYDAYVYRALTNVNVLNQPSLAVPDFQQFLALAPADHPQRELVTSALAEAVGGASATGTPTTVGAP